MRDSDRAARVVQDWKRERPDLDATPILVLGRLSEADAAVEAVLRPPFAEEGLASGDFNVLAALRRQGSPYADCPSDLAEATLVTPGATTKRLDRLERQGLVTRTVTPADGRGREVRLTAAGLALVDRLIEVHLANESRVLASFSAAEQRTFARLLGRLTSAAHAITEEGTQP